MFAVPAATAVLSEDHTSVYPARFSGVTVAVNVPVSPVLRASDSGILIIGVGAGV